VWFIIWPAQQKIIGWVKAGQSPAEMPKIVRKAYLASRTNTYLSIPMLFGMGAASHFPSFSIVAMLIVAAFGGGIAWLLIQVSPKVGLTT
jgi:uncharacterized membrane protein